MNEHTIRLQHAAKAAWSEWLSAEPWDLFVTLTDPGQSHPEHMYKRTRYLVNQMNRSLYGRNYWKRGQGIETVIGLERQERGSVHSHSLLRFPDHDIRDPAQISLRYWQKFATELGGWARLDRPKNSADVVAYVTKYVVKGGDLVIGETFNPTVPRSFSHTLLGGRLH